MESILTSTSHHEEDAYGEAFNSLSYLYPAICSNLGRSFHYVRKFDYGRTDFQFFLVHN